MTLLLVTVSVVRAAEEPMVRLVADERRTQSPSTIKLEFELSAVPAGRQARLGLDARINWNSPAGSNPWMAVSFNGQGLGESDLINKPFEFTMLCGMDTTWAYGPWWRICYAPDFSDTLRTGQLPYAIPDSDPFGFVWDVTRHVKAGQNVLRIRHKKVLTQGSTLVLRNIRVEIGEPVASKVQGIVRPAPTGPLPTYVAQGRKAVAMGVQLDGADLRLEVSGRTLQLRSRTNAPGGQWAEASQGDGANLRAEWVAANHRVVRAVTVRDDHVQVADTISNTTQGLVGVMVEHRLVLPREPKQVLLGGHPTWAATQKGGRPYHPSALACFDDIAVGLIAEDDVFRVHVEAFREPGTIGLADPLLGIPPGGSHTLEWSVYPAPDGDYWDFINAVRRNWGANFTIPSAICFDPTTSAGTEDLGHYREWLNRRGLKTLVSGQTYFVEDGAQPKGILAEGTAIPMAKRWCANIADWTRKVHTVDPMARVLIYIHAQICTEPNAQVRYADCKLLDASGNHVTSPYHYPVYIYLSTLENAYGKALMEAAKETLEVTGADGFYCDEMSWASRPYAYRGPWDGCTVAIDRKTHAVAGKRSSVCLLQQSWKVAFVEWLRRKGKEIIGNSPANTRTMLDLHIPRFREMASYSFLIDTHLGSPWGLGNHDADRTDRGHARQARRFLDHAGVFTTYVWHDAPKVPPFQPLMYPITPVELRAGMVLGRERILTNRSGRYGWPDGSPAKVHVIGPDGQRVAGSPVKEMGEKGQRRYEARMPSDHFAILVRQ